MELDTTQTGFSILGSPGFLPIQGAKIAGDINAVLSDAGLELLGPNDLPGMTTSHEGNSDADGDGHPDPDIPVNGHLEDNEFGPGTVVGGGGDPFDPGWGGAGGGSNEPPPQQPQDCRDRNALEATDTINGHPDDTRREHGSLTYVGSDGSMQHSPPIHGTAGSISREAITTWMSANGVSWSQVRGFVHNHDDFWYGGSSFNENVNRYPSGGPSDPQGGDWRTAEWMVNQGAGGPNGGYGFALYIIDTDGNLREFEYSRRSEYENLTNDQRNAGIKLPDEMESDGSSCG